MSKHVSVYACVSLLLWVSTAVLFHIYMRPSMESIVCECCICLGAKSQIASMGVWRLFPWAHSRRLTFAECLNDIRANCAGCYRELACETLGTLYVVLVQWFSTTNFIVKAPGGSHCKHVCQSERNKEVQKNWELVPDGAMLLLLVVICKFLQPVFLSRLKDACKLLAKYLWFWSNRWAHQFPTHWEVSC